MLLYQPFSDYYGAWRALEEMYLILNYPLKI